MRFHMNPQFVAEKAKVANSKAALDHERAMVDHPSHPADELSLQNAQDSLDCAVADFVCAPAYNGREMLLQLEMLLGHTDEWLSNGGAFENGLTAAARPQPSPPMIAAFASFRTAWVEMAEHDLSSVHTNENEQRLHAGMFAAQEGVFAVCCATPGDFLVKAYVNLLWHAGHTASAHLRNGDTGSFFDIALSEIDSDSVLTDTYYRSVYDDIDHSDLGACLVALGSIDFDPGLWIDRAESIGMSVSVIVADCFKPRLAFGMIDSADDRLQREERRLQQIMTFDHRSRWPALLRFITEHRPELVAYKVPAVEVSAA